jgi:hypothetical protein
MIIVIDFDGTVVTHEFPRIGKDIGAVPVLKALTDAGNQLILFTMRSDIAAPKSENPLIHAVGGNYLTDAINWFKDNDIPLWGIQTNPTQLSWTTSPKAYGEMYIDDAGFGCPLRFDASVSHRPFVDWVETRRRLEAMNLIKTTSDK